MVYCFVPHCYNGSSNSTCDKQTRDEDNHIAFFSPPKDEKMLKKWKVKIGRVDRELSHRDKVCSIHFNEDDIKRTSEKVIGGEKVTRKLKCVRLNDGAIPTIFPGKQFVSLVLFCLCCCLCFAIFFIGYPAYKTTCQPKRRHPLGSSRDQNTQQAPSKVVDEDTPPPKVPRRTDSSKGVLPLDIKLYKKLISIIVFQILKILSTILNRLFLWRTIILTILMPTAIHLCLLTT